MSTISLAAFSAGAPGTRITESAASGTSTPTIATHNSVYMLVEVPSEVPVTLFPENVPTEVYSLNDYLNIIGGTVPLSGSELLSYYNVESFFLNAQAGVLYVVRVPQPASVQRLVLKPTGKKDNGAAVPSDFQQGDVVYLQLLMNGQELGDKNNAGQYRGVRVEIPADYEVGNVTNSLLITQAFAEAIEAALNEDRLISSSVYLRNYESDTATGETHMDFTGKVLGQPIILIPQNSPIDNLFIGSLSTYDVQNLSVEDLPDQGPWDYLQCIRTAFDGSLGQGFLCAPTAFAKFTSKYRAIIGKAMEALCSDADHKWVALIDPGPFDVTDLDAYSVLEEHSPGSGFETDDVFLVKNSVYKWTDADYQFRQMNFGLTADDCINSNIDKGYDQRVSLQDDRKIIVSAANTGNGTLTLAEDWPIYADGFTTGARIILKESTIGGLDNDTYYVIASDVEGTLAANEIRLASTRANALANTAILPTLTGTALVTYLEYAFDQSVTIGANTSNLVEALADDQAFNSAYIPASLQKPTQRVSLRNTVRRLEEFESCLVGTSPKFVPTADIGIGDETFTVTAHGYSDGDKVFVGKIPGATAPSKSSGGAIAALSIATPGTNYTDGSYTGVPLSGGSGSGATANITVSDGAVTVVTINDTGGDYVSGDTPLTVDDSLIGGDSTGEILTTDTIVDGSGYADGTYNGVSLTGGTGTGATADITVSGGAITVVNIVSGGTGYVVDDTLSAADADLGSGGGAGFSVDVATIDPAGSGFTATADTASAITTVELFGFYFVTESTTNTFKLSTNQAGTSIVRVNSVGSNSATFRSDSVFSIANLTINGEDLGLLIEAHGLAQGDKVMFDQNVVDGDSKSFLLGSTSDSQNFYYVNPADANIVQLAVSLASLGDGQYINLPANPEVTPSASVLMFTPFEYETESDPFNDYTELRLVRGRKYQYDLTLSEYNLLDENADVIADRRVVSRWVQDVTVTNQAGFYYGYLTQANATPIDSGNLPSVSDVYFNAPLEASVSNYVVIGIEDTSGTLPPPTSVVAGSALPVVLTPFIEPPAALWNFKAITGTNLVDEALRGINNAGVPQAELVDQGVDTHAKLIDDGELYGTSKGFLAYYGPYVENDYGVFVSPTPFACGVAVRRYRSEGFQYPPAGVNYLLRGANATQISISSNQQEVSNPLGINALRSLPGYPANNVYIWGGRTRVNRADSTQKLYQFINTRVILNVVYGSLRGAFDSDIFSVVDGQNVLFTKLRSRAESLLYVLWAGGALFGTDPNSAYSVICDRRNNPSASLEEGIVFMSAFVVPSPTMERLEIELVRVAIDGVDTALTNSGF